MAKIVLTRLTCNETEDNTGPDEACLKIWADSDYQSLRRSMNNGSEWNLNVILDFSQRVKIKLYDLDNPGFPWYDDHDHLGTVIINPSQANSPGNGTFNLDGADYEIEWIPMDRELERQLSDHRQAARSIARSDEPTLGEFRRRSDGNYVVSGKAMEELLDSTDPSHDEGEAERSVLGSKHTYCCQMGNDGNVSKRQQFRSYSWQAPLFCMRMARNNGYNSGSVSRGECRGEQG